MAPRAKSGVPSVDPQALTPSEVAILADLSKRMQVVRDALQTTARLPLAELITGWSLEVDRMVLVADASPVVPVVTGLSPNQAVLGSPSFTLRVTGSGFDAGAVIVFAGQDEPTTVVSPTEVTTGVNMAVWLGPDTVPVAVRGASGTSAPLPFTFSVAAG